MSGSPHTADRRVERLLRCYPRSWRERYGDEFAALLSADIAERPRSVRRDIDVIASGVRARLAGSGLAGAGLDPLRQLRAGLAAESAALAVFLAFGVAIWAQLTIGWQWSAPASPALRSAASSS